MQPNELAGAAHVGSHCTKSDLAVLVCVVAQCTTGGAHTSSLTLMQRLTFAKQSQMYLSLIVNIKGGSSGQSYQTHKEITRWCFYQSESVLQLERTQAYERSKKLHCPTVFFSESLSSTYISCGWFNNT